MNTNLEYYKFFYYVGKLHSITLAAEELNVSQPAVSQAIRNLERELGTTLFMRTSRGVRLTAEGQTLYGYVQRGYETIREGERKFLEMQELTSGEVCIGASDMTLQFYLLSYLEQFHEQYPKIRITVTNAPTPETLKYLQSGRIDFGVVSTPMETTKNMHVIPVREIEDVFVAGRKFEYLKGGKLSYKELEHLPVMCLEGNTSTRKYVEEFLLGEGVVIHPEIELATSDMLIQFAKRSLGIANVVRDFAQEEIDKAGTGDLCPVKHSICQIQSIHNGLGDHPGRLVECLGTGHGHIGGVVAVLALLGHFDNKGRQGCLVQHTVRHGTTQSVHNFLF